MLVALRWGIQFNDAVITWGFIYFCIGAPAPLFLLSHVAGFLSFCIFAGSSHQGGYWKSLFCFPEVALWLKFVVSPLPTHGGLFSECGPCLCERALAAILRSPHKGPPQSEGRYGFSIGGIGGV